MSHASRWLDGLHDAAILKLTRFFRLRNSADQVARGFAVGVACCFLPTFGFGGFIAAAAARLVGGSLVAGFAGGCALAFAWPVLFVLNLQVGGVFFRPEVSVDEVDELTPAAIDAVLWGKAFLLGTAINASAAAIMSYALVVQGFPRLQPTALGLLRRRMRLRRYRDVERNPKNVT